MALQLSTNGFGTTFTNAYYKIEAVRVTKNGVSFTVHGYATDLAIDLIYGEVYEMDYDAAGGEPLTQAYSYLKTLPEFAGAVDV